MKALILAGGLGIRLQSVTEHLPKVMLPIGGKPALEHLIDLCARHRIHDIIVTLHYLPDEIRRYFGDGGRFNVRLSYSYEPQKMGTAGAVKHASGLLGQEAFFVLNGDVMTNVDLSAMRAFHERKGGLGTFLVHRTDHPYDSDLVAYDRYFIITRLYRPQPGEDVPPVSKSGTHIFQPEVLNFIPQGAAYSLERDLIPDLLSKKQRLYAYYSDCYSKDMGTPERLAHVEEDYQHGAF
jgi:mannose-1-phosphate guanylyltransferase/phosphomannomutase